MHRIQLAGWTAILLVWYLRAVYLDWALPDFDISLVGISAASGAFHLASKRNERISRSEIISPERRTKHHASTHYSKIREPRRPWRARIVDALLRLFHGNRAKHNDGGREHPEQSGVTKGAAGGEGRRRKHSK
jgi:hypothetical protein